MRDLLSVWDKLTSLFVFALLGENEPASESKRPAMSSSYEKNCSPTTHQAEMRVFGLTYQVPSRSVVDGTEQVQIGRNAMLGVDVWDADEIAREFLCLEDVIGCEEYELNLVAYCDLGPNASLDTERAMQAFLNDRPEYILDWSFRDHPVYGMEAMLGDG